MSELKDEALRLADELERAVKQEDADDQVISVARWFVDDAAAELRRLVAKNEALRAKREPMNEFDALRLITESIGRLQSAGPVEGLIGIIRAVEQAHGIGSKT